MATDSTPPSTPKPTSGIGSLSAREGEMLAKAWSCLKSGPPEIDYPKLAAEMGMANHRSAINLWGAIKKKMQWNTGATPASASKATGTAASGKRKKPVASAKTANNGDDSENDGDDDNHEDEATPSKKPKTATPRGKANVGVKTPLKKQAAPRKPKTPTKAAVVKAEASDSEMKDGEDDKKASGQSGEIVKDEAAEDDKVVKAEAEAEADENGAENALSDAV